MKPHHKLLYLASIFLLILVHIEWEALIWERHLIWDPLLLTVPGMIVGWLYIVGEMIQRYYEARGGGVLLGELEGFDE